MTPEEQIQAQLEKDRGQRTPQQTNPANLKMGLGIFLIALVLSLIADFAELVTAGTLGWFVGIFVDFILLLILGISKGARKQWKKIVVAIVGETVPIVATLPLRTLFLIWAFISSRSSALRAVTGVMKKTMR